MFLTQEMCDDVVCKEAWLLEFVLDWFKTQEICERAVKEGRDSLIHVPAWFVVAQEMWCEDLWCDDNDYLFRWCNT